MTDSNVIYFAYGSNMSEQQMSQRLDKAVKPLGVARLNGYALGFYGQSITWGLTGTADIVPSTDKSDYVKGALYKLSEADIQLMDKREIGPHSRYKKIFVDVLYGGKLTEALTYVLNRDGPKKDLEVANKPSEKYLSQCVSSAKALGIEASYINKYLAAET